MNKKFLIYGVGLAILATLVYLQFHAWKNFDWPTFWRQWKRIDLRHILLSIGLIYITYLLRALRWSILLRSVRRETSWLGLVSPTVVGFAGLALLGRPGELIRPFLIARRENLNFSSQMAAWTVERIFDIGGFTVLLALAVFLPGTALHLVPKYRGIEIFGLLFVALTAGVSLGAVLIAKFGEAVSVWVEARFSHLAKNLGRRIAERLREFHRGLDTIHSPIAFFQIAGVSLSVWGCVALSYFEVVRAYGAPLQPMTISKVLPLVGSSMVGSLIQLPGVGGGSQLATISAMQQVFGVAPELAASCGITLWLVTFVSIVPLGLALAHRERLSLRKLSQESREEGAGSPPPK
jgi:uncharacterized protein (TIRG00374 family)